jgi:hypothetical protein
MRYFVSLVQFILRKIQAMKGHVQGLCLCVCAHMRVMAQQNVENDVGLHVSGW